MANKVPDQSIQLWGNTRANLYWEAHLKPGHMPPEQSVDLIQYAVTHNNFRPLAKWSLSYAPNTNLGDGHWKGRRQQTLLL